MKKILMISILFITLSFIKCYINCLNAQLITVPDYCYGNVWSKSANVSYQGTIDPAPWGNESYGEVAKATGIFMGKGFRWWTYPGFGQSPCSKPHKFDYPGWHGITDETMLGCVNPPIGYNAGWGGIIVDPAGKKIICLNGAKNANGPTNPACVPTWLGGIICYPPPGTWGESHSYGYLRKTVVVQSTGLLQPGDPVNIKTTIHKEPVHEGDGIFTSNGLLFLNKLSGTILYYWAGGMDYLRWSEIQDILHMPLFVDNMLALLQVDENNTQKDSTVTVSVGDTIVLELMFNQSIELINPMSPVESEGWAAKEPDEWYSGINYIRTDSVRNLVRKHGNSLSYDLTCLTQGAILSPLTPGGPNVDEDNDGISDSREKGADGNDNTFDGNDDGIPDYKQTNVASFHTYDGLNYVTLSVPVGTELSELKVTNNPSPSNAPADAEFPWGFFDFSIDGIDPGETVTVTLILHNGAPAGKYFKYGLTPTDNLEPHWYDFTFDGQTGAQINGNVIILHFVDGLRGDEDITENGSIKEPGAPAIAGSTGIPELNEKTGLVVYPNPAGDNITLKLNNILPGNNYLITIFSNTGEIVRQKIIDVCDSNEEFNVPTANLSSGFYLITLSGGNFNYKAKFIKLK